MARKTKDSAQASVSNLMTLMEQYIQANDARFDALAKELRDIRTAKPATASEAASEAPVGKARKGKGKAKGKAKLNLDVAQFASSKLPPSSEKAVRKVQGWANTQNIARLREYAGTGPRVSGEGEPRVAVVEGNRILAQNVLADCFDSKGKPTGKGEIKTRIRKARKAS